MDNIYKAVQLTVDSQNLALSKTPTHIYIANQYVDTNDTPLITAPFIIQKALENGTGVVDIVSSTIGSIYEVRLLSNGETLISGYFYMPPMNVNFSELELYTSYPPRTPPVVNEFWQKTENFILEKTNTLLNFVQVFNAVSSMRLSLGYLEELLTDKKQSLVAAINEVFKSIEPIESINEMLAIKNPRDGTRVYVKSYHAGLNKGGGTFVYDSAKATINDGGVVINGWVRQINPYIDASMFGAKGDGVTDDTASIQNYVNFLISNGGGVLRITKGNYRITKTIVVDGKISIVGEIGTKITVDTDSEPFEIKNANGQCMTGLEIDGKDKAFYGLSLWNTEYYLIDNVYVHNTGGIDPFRGDGSGIRLIDSSFVIVSRCKTVDIGSDGILTLQCKHVVIDGCWSERCKRHNYSFSEYTEKRYSEHCVLINSTGIDSALSGIDLESGVRCTVANNNFNRNGKYLNAEKYDLASAIAVAGWSYGNRITNNTIIDPQTDGVFVVQTTDQLRTNEYGLEPVATVIADNYILNTGRNGVFIAGNENQANDKQSWNVHSNIIHNPAKNGIKLGWFTKNANINNNTITNSGELAISGVSNDKCNITHNNIDTNGDGISLSYSKNLIILANNININGTDKKYINIDMSANVAENIIIANNITNADRANNATLLNIYANGGAKNIKVRDNIGVGSLYPLIKFNLGDFDGQSVEVHHNGSRYYKTIGWVNVSERFITAISSAPNYIGQMAIVSNIAYIATGTASASDWKQITN